MMESIVDYGELTELMISHLPLILENREKILAEPRLAAADPNAWLRIGRERGPTVSLGGLVHAWGEGILLHPCDCGGKIHIHRLGVIPGHAEISEGVCPQCLCRGGYARPKPGEQAMLRLKEGLAAVAKYSDQPPDRLPFKQVLNVLLEKPAEAFGYDNYRSPLIVYDYLSAALTNRVTGHLLCRWRRGRCELPDGSSADSAGLGVFTWPGGKPRLEWKWHRPDQHAPGLPKSGLTLLTRGRADSEQEILCLDEFTLYARHHGKVLQMTDDIPVEMLGVWAWRRGLLDTAFEEEADGCLEGR